ncbi:MAG TPA: OmpH family outer membrane protein [Accumulibacter sp.]|uniref:OmpH family outer membrane protein n=1 Tax=Accumulibacter sp. TaxID=2053492 RepID=UPI002623DF7E|nr:OmpH family outer membrane protein [Accumulibacter sp.]MDS4011203.1 OmpH family outer membrane protein [Defluviicoccus sp.]MDS4013858.1 OmpH family outer membrane protein [Accumulibacter sp.]MDS4053434.1 OmpH family outer membrane protein [Accumulibacter sp.]HMV04895.1 OmpH family outer membrane protein [Accumulibacter sp.]HMW62694.1 OmpH family outer membrane protein [Accumulibacter sp.]
MKKTIAPLLVALLASLPASYASAVDQLKVGYVNTQRLFRDAPAAVRAAKRIEQEFTKRDQDLQRLAKQVQALQETLEKNGLTMAESERRTKEKDLAELSREFQRKQREFREDLNLRQNEENAAIIEKANKAIKQLAENEKYDLIVQDVVWVSPRLDITDKVIKALSEAKEAK